MRIRRYEPDDLSQITALFYDTVHAVNAADYSPEQLDAWADGAPDRDRWNRSLLAHHSLVAVEGEGLIVGFGDIDGTGYLDRLYVHRDRQGQGHRHGAAGPAGAGGGRTRDHHPTPPSRPGRFLRPGYRVIREQRVERHGVRMTNFVMEKWRQDG